MLYTQKEFLAVIKKRNPYTPHKKLQRRVVNWFNYNTSGFVVVTLREYLEKQDHSELLATLPEGVLNTRMTPENPETWEPRKAGPVATVSE